MLKLVRLVRTHKDAIPPKKATTGAAGYDLYSVEYHSIYPGDQAIVDTGFKIAIPDGYEGQVRPRSGLAAKHGVTVTNSPGTIDCDYRGPLKVILTKLEDPAGGEPFEIAPGDRIAQLVISEVPNVGMHIVEEFDDETERGEGGFGSTGS